MPKYIDADALLAEAKRLSGPMTGDGWSNWGVYALIGRQPVADVVPMRRGHWVKMTGMMPPEFAGHYGCSECGWCGKNFLKETDFDFCPGCGADMRKEADDA